MRSFFLSLFYATLLALLLVPARSADEPSLAPRRFKALIGGFPGSSYTVELRDDGTLDYGVRGRGQGGVVHTKITPTPVDWREFRAASDAIDVWKWEGKFRNDSVNDGTQWSLEIAYADHELKSAGSNSYPDAKGKPNGKPEMTPAFNRYLAAVKKLTGGRAFE